MDKKSKLANDGLTCGNEGTKEDISSPFFCWNLAVGEGRADFEKEKVFRERKSNFSLDFPVFEPSVFVRPRSKVTLRCKCYAWTPIMGIFDNSGR